MPLLPLYKYFVFNSVLKPVSEFIPSENEGGIYEVVRIINGVPLFLEDHLKRFYLSAQIAGKTIRFSEDQIKGLLIRLIAQNNINEGNVLISCKTNLKVFFIPHKYPSMLEYKNGVKCGILEAERVNPNAKVFQTTVRKQANELIQKYTYYEVLLKDHVGRITEGSRSNVFFVKGDVLITPPANEVLLGITRQKTISCASKLGYKVLEEDIYFKNLEFYDAVLITGTSPKILPLRNVGDISFNAQNKLLRKLMEAYDLLIEEYIKTA